MSQLQKGKDSRQYNVYLFGTGGFADRYLHMIEEIIRGLPIYILGFMDHDEAKCGKTYEGYQVVLPKKIRNDQYDYIVVFLYKENFKEVKNQLIITDSVSSDKIICFLDFVNIIHATHRRAIPQGKRHTSQVYDCFTFFNEIDVLKIRMEILYPFVDHFVIVEMTKDHRGRKKPLVFKEKMGQFKEYMDKVIYICPENMPEVKEVGKGKDFTLENFQRNSILLGLEKANSEDIVCISDCDEIPNPEIYENIKRRTKEGKRINEILDENIIALEQDFMYYYFNCVHKVKWYGSVMIKKKNLIVPQICRELAYIYYLPVPGRQYGQVYFPVLKNGGWHLTYFGGLKSVLKKTETLVSAEKVEEDDLISRIENGLDPYGREGVEYELSFVDDEQISIPNFAELKKKYPDYYHGEQVK